MDKTNVALPAKGLTKAPTKELPCRIHRMQIPDHIIGDNKPHIYPMLGLTRILKVDTKNGLDMHIWYMSSPEKTEAHIELWVFATGAEVPNHLSYVCSVVTQATEEVWHIFVNPTSFPKDRPYITH